MTNRYLDAESVPAPTPRPLRQFKSRAEPRTSRRAGAGRCCKSRAVSSTRRQLPQLWEFVGAANDCVDAEKPWEHGRAWKAGDEVGPGAPAWRAWRPDRGLSAPRRRGRAIQMPWPRMLSGAASADYPYRIDGNGGPPKSSRSWRGAPAPARTAASGPRNYSTARGRGRGRLTPGLPTPSRWHCHRESAMFLPIRRPGRLGAAGPSAPHNCRGAALTSI